MATTQEKRKELIRLLKGDARLADEIIGQAEATEKQADDLEMKYKERRSAAAPFANVPAYLPPATSGIGAVMGRK